MPANPSSHEHHAELSPRSNTIRLGGKDLERVLDQIDQNSPNGKGYQRTFVRWPYRRACVQVDMISGARTCSSLLYACRNLSGGGMSIMHSAYVHPGTECIVHLPRVDGEIVPLQGRITRCRHFRGHIHEVGIRFDETIEIARFVDLDPFKSRFSLEHVDPAQLQGTLLHCESAELDRKLLRHFLRETNLQVVGVGTVADARGRLKEGFDCIIVDSSLSDGDGFELARQLRDDGYQQPVIMTSADASMTTRNAAKNCRASAFLAKPLSAEMLFRALADLLLTKRHTLDGAGPIHCSLKPDDPAWSMVPELITQLHSIAKALQVSLDGGEIQQLRALCQRVKGSAPPLGFEPVGTVAESALRSLQASMSVAESGPQVRALIAACLRVKSESDAARKAA